MPLSSADAVLAPWPVFEDDEIELAATILRSGRVNYWTGDEGRAFEREYAAQCGVGFGLAVANGTVAIELALYGLGIGPGDEVIVPAKTFVATVFLQLEAEGKVSLDDKLDKYVPGFTHASEVTMPARSINLVEVVPGERHDTDTDDFLSSIRRPRVKSMTNDFEAAYKVMAGMA